MEFQKLSHKSSRATAMAVITDVTKSQSESRRSRKCRDRIIIIYIHLHDLFQMRLANWRDFDHKFSTDRDVLIDLFRFKNSDEIEGANYNSKSGLKMNA